LQDDYRASGLVIRCIEPVAKVVGLVAMRFVTTLIVEVVYRYGEVISRIDVAEVDGSGSNERQSADEKRKLLFTTYREKRNELPRAPEEHLQ
jgi:hypothetical protein